ncbi:MAG TPA: hypothetical protein PLZ36_03345 [Armatimonadota bacterium]|nr:hypothetical protein [Armatimonadota bacterium]
MRPFRLLLSACCLLVMLGLTAQTPDRLLMESASVQTAVLDPANWDTVFANETYFDALRAMLVRFPGVAEQVYPRLQQGYRIEKAELALVWKAQEGKRPERGRGGWGADELYENYPGAWHVQAWALNRPWSVDRPELGPTFNAWVNGGGYWARGGGRGDGTDRFPRLFGPLPLHANSPVARLDVTPVLTDAAYGRTPAERLRAVEERGFQVQKMEIRDMKYRNFYAYDWSVGIGYMKIWVQQPKLVVTLVRDGKAEKPGNLPPPANLAALAARAGGTPAVAVPADWKARIAQHLAKPEGVPDWQWARIQQLRAIGPAPTDSELYLGRGYNFAPLWAGDEAAYLKSMQYLLKMAPRTWHGHPTGDFALLPAAYGDLLPPAVLDHLKVYWAAWLHPEAERSLDSLLGGGTHRGGPTYFRGYVRGIGTTNFNHNAVAGALLGAQLIDSPYVLDDARYGLENILLRMQVFSDGVHQETGDTYYQAITVAGAGTLAKYAAAPSDKLMGRILRDRLVEPLISMYHPGLRRMTHPMARGDYSYQLLLQEGPYHVLHTLSPKGVLLHLDGIAEKRTGTPMTWGKVHGISIIGDEAPPQRIAVLSPWIEPHLAETWARMVDEKPLPWTVYSRDDFAPGERFGGWHVNHLDANFALASRDNTNSDYGTVPITGQWRRKAERVDRMDDFSTLQLNFGVNGQYTPSYQSMGEFGVVQHGGTLLALKALPERRLIEGAKAVTALHASAVIFATGDCAAREVWINDRKADALSGARPDPGGEWKKRMFTTGAVAQAKTGDRIAIRDGATYVGLIPIAVNPLERDVEVELSYEYPTLLIHAFLRRGTEPLNLDRLYQADAPPTAGFLLRMANAADFADFDAFRAHLAGIELTAGWHAAEKTADVVCRVGADMLEMRYDPLRFPAVARAVNGQWPYVPDGIQRDTPWSVQGITGRLEKGGAVLENEPGRTGYLLASPETDMFVGYNPLPDLTAWRMTVPGDITLFADARVSLLRAAVRPKAGAVTIDYAAKPDQRSPDMATALFIAGTTPPPAVTLNGRKLGKLATATVNGEAVYVVPLAAAVAADAPARSARFQALAGAGQPAFFRGWLVAGPFPRDFSAVNPPETGAINLKATYSGHEKAAVKWQPVVTAGDPTIGPDPVDLKPLLAPHNGVCAYAYGIIRSDRDRAALLLTGSDEEMAVWLNGARVYAHTDYYRAFYRDQDRTPVTLKQGDNPVLVKLGHGWESWRFSMRLAQPDGMPLTEGITFVTPAP